MTIAKVAKLASVSAATVSRVINKHPGVSPEIAKQVQKVMDSIGYVPPPLNRRRGRRGASVQAWARADCAPLVLIVPETRTSGYPSLLYGFTEAANQHGRQVIICKTDNQVERQADALLRLLDQGSGGVALHSASQGPAPSHHIRCLQKNGIPVVLLRRSMAGVEAPLIELPYEEVGYLAASRLLKMGHRRIASIIAHRAPYSERYEEGLRRAMEEAGESLPEELVYYGQMLTRDDMEASEAEVEAVLRQMLAMPARSAPTAIFTSIDYYGEMIVSVLRRLGIEVPERMSVVSFGGKWTPSVSTQQLSAVTVDEEAVGARAAELLCQMHRKGSHLSTNYRERMELGFREAGTIAPPGRVSRRVAKEAASL